jgi:hypothetical protein
MIARTLPLGPHCLDDTLPDSADILVKQIQTFAHIRRNEAALHPSRCSCTGCYVSNYDELRRTARRAG